MDKGRFAITMLLTVGAVFLVMHLMKGGESEKSEKKSKSAAAVTELAAIAPKLQQAKVTRTLGSLDADSNYKMLLHLTPTEAAIDHVELTDYSKRDDKNAPCKLLQPVIQKLDSVKLKNRALATRKLTFTFPQHKHVPPSVVYDAEESWKLLEDKTVDNKDRKEIVFERVYPVKGAKGTNVLRLRKTYTLLPNSYSVQVKFEVENLLAQPIQLTVEQLGPLGLGREGVRSDQRSVVAGLYDQETIMPVMRGVSELEDYELNAKKSIDRKEDDEEEVFAISWFGAANQYFGAYLHLMPKNSDKLIDSDVPIQYFVESVKVDKTENNELGRAWLTGFSLDKIPLAAAGQDGSSQSYNFDVFLGPKDRQILNKDSLYKKLKYEDTIKPVGGCGFCTFDWLMKGLMWMLSFFAGTLFFGNYGLAIILLVIIVRGVLHPLTKKGQVSMSKMQKQMAALKPKLDKVREKYADDKVKQQQEMMKIQREHGLGAGSMLGCLPMFLQMPIWVALFSGLNTEIALRGAAFLPVWITDLSSPDHLIHLGVSIPWVGEYFNLLPILLCVAMYLQSKFNPSMQAGANMSPEQAQQQKIMKFMMPVMMLIFFYKAPSGLNLYIMTSTFAGVAEQFFIRKHIREEEEASAAGAGEVVVKASGRGPRGSRPKKPKGPFNAKRG